MPLIKGKGAKGEKGDDGLQGEKGDKGDIGLSGGFEIPTIIKTEAGANDKFIGIDEAGIPYIITKNNLLAGLSSGGNGDTLSGGGGGSDVDALFSSVVLLLSNIENGDTFTVNDLSSVGSLVANNNVTLSTINKFSPKSFLFGGGTQTLVIPTSSNFNLTDEDFFVESWIYPTVVDNNGRIFFSKVGSLSNNSNRGYALSFSNAGLTWYWTENGITDQTVSFACNIPVNIWSHVAVGRKKVIDAVDGNTNTLYGFLNGILISSVAHTPIYYNSTANLTIGSFGGYAADGYPQLSFIGNIEKKGLRLTRKCRHTASFPLPTKAFYSP